MALTKHQRFSTETVLRSSIKEHPRNPRRIGAGAKKKLRDKMKEVGLIQPLIVNRTSGYLVGGHQRLEALDSLERYRGDGSSDYSLEVAMVELDEKAELEMLVFLNNTSAQGDWDLDILADFGGSVGFGEMGFDRADVEVLFGGDSRFDMAFIDTVATKGGKDALDSIREDGKQAGDGAAVKEESLAAIKKHRAEYKELSAQAENVDYYVTVVCKDKNEKDRLMAHLGIPKGELYISPSEILALSK